MKHVVEATFKVKVELEVPPDLVSYATPIETLNEWVYSIKEYVTRSSGQFNFVKDGRLYRGETVEARLVNVLILEDTNSIEI